MRVGIIDLGTNTFNLLIADVFKSSFDVVFTTKIGVGLGIGGLQKKEITPEAEERAHDAFYVFKDFLRQFEVEKVKGIATSMVRDALNGQKFTNKLFDQFGIEIEIVSGKREADLILQGVSWLYDFNESALIMDIGGGSTEFIFKDLKTIQQLSLDIGVSRMFQMRTWTDPLSDDDIESVLNQFNDLSLDLNSFPKPKILIGASGSFETFYEMANYKHFPEKETNIRMSRDEIDRILDWILASTQEEREAHPYIIPIRKKLAPMAAIQTRWILEKFNIREILISPYSLKEGALKEFLV